MARDWSLKGWHTGKQMTLLQAFGFRKSEFHFPQLTPVLTTRAAEFQRPIEVSSGGTQPVTETGNTPKPKGPVQQYARKLLRENGWGGQWDSFNNIVMAESGWNPKVANPFSGAYGIAQANGHGNLDTQGTYSNMYGGYGLTDRQAKAANSGDPYWQLVWMMNYIKLGYGDPNSAWAFHQANGYY